MKIKWEKNGKVLSLAAQGKIKAEDILPRSRTDEFPTSAATVRIQRLSDKTPSVTVHIKGKSDKRTNTYSNHTWECANTCRVNIANDWKTGTMSCNGELDEDYDWQDVHNVVTRVKEAMDIN